MPAPTPFSSTHNQPLFPALYLYPLNDSFVPKHITLLHNQRIKIGRQTNVKTVPAERNGYFDSKVLSRQHAEVWEETGKIFIKDVKSSNGTFINGERLSPEGLESEPYELKSDDIVEFGIDIVGEDNKTIIHHKVAARVVCIFSEQDVQIAARAEHHQSSSSLSTISNQASSSSAGNSFNFSGNQGGPSSSQRRPALQQQGLAGMGGMGGSMRPPGKSGLTFDHILSRLQGELQKSRETGSELQSLTGAMNDIHDTLGGALAPNLPPYPHSLPPVRPTQQQPQNEMSSPPEQNAAPPVSALTELQAQLHDTQSSLASHVDKIRALEGVLAEHEAMKREVSSLREMMEERKREMESARSMSPLLMHHHGRGQHNGDISGEFDGDGDDDDGGSIRTIVPQPLERVEEEDEDQLAADEEEEEEERRRRREELGRPRTPEPTGMGMNEYDSRHTSKLLSAPRRGSLSPPSLDQSARTKSSSVVDELTQRLATLSDQLESALELSNSLQAQHTAAQTTISALENKVSALEVLVQATQSQVHSQTLAQEARDQADEAARLPSQDHERERESLTRMLNDWKKGVEGQWSSVQEEWNQERERLSKAKDEWESKVKAVEAGLGSAVARVDSGLASLAAAQTQFQHQRHLVNGDAKHNGSGGLVTPPSPRSLSSDSNRPRQRRKRSSSSRGRSRSFSLMNVGDGRGPEDFTDNSSAASASASQSGMSPKSRPYSPSLDDPNDTDLLTKDAKATSARFLATPESLHSYPPLSTEDPAVPKVDSTRFSLVDRHPISVSTAVGVLVLSVAAAAVIWRVKPE